MGKLQFSNIYNNGTTISGQRALGCDIGSTLVYTCVLTMVVSTLIFSALNWDKQFPISR